MSDLELATNTFHSEGVCFALARDGRVLATGSKEGIGELLESIESLGEQTHGAALADKIVGKAVAMVAVHAGILSVYSPLASEAAEEVLAAEGIQLVADRTVPLILNKRGDGACPMERLTLPLQEPAEAVAALKVFSSTTAPRFRGGN